MKKFLAVDFYKIIKTKLSVVIAVVLYFGLLALTMYLKISQNGVNENIIRLAVVVSAFGLGSYIMFFYSEKRLAKRHVVQNTEREFGITKKRIIIDKIIAVLFLIVGVVLMVLTIL